MAFIEDEHEVLAIDLMRAVLADEYRQLLYGGDDDACLWVFQLTFQYGCVGVAVGCTFLEAVVFLHGLVVQVLAVHSNNTLSMYSTRLAKRAVLNEVSVLPLPVVCHT